MESLSTKIKKIKYHIIDVGLKVILIDHTCGNEKFVYGQIIKLNYVDNIKNDVVISFIQNDIELEINLSIFDPNFELLKIINLRSQPLDEKLTLVQLYTMTLEIGDKITYIQSVYSKTDEYDIELYNAKIVSINNKNIKVEVNYNEKYNFLAKYSCTKANGIISNRCVLSFVVFKKLDDNDKLFLINHFYSHINGQAYINQNLIPEADRLKRQNILNKYVRNYNTNILFEYLDKIFPDGNINE